jgi:hypothetical protein
MAGIRPLPCLGRLMELALYLLVHPASLARFPSRVRLSLAACPVAVAAESQCRSTRPAEASLPPGASKGNYKL